MVDSLHPPCMSLMRQKPAVQKNYVKYVFLIRFVRQIIHDKNRSRRNYRINLLFDYRYFVYKKKLSNDYCMINITNLRENEACEKY